MKYVFLLTLIFVGCTKQKEYKNCDYLTYKQKVSIVGGFYIGQKGKVEERGVCWSDGCGKIIKLNDGTLASVKCEHIVSSPGNICFDFPYLPACEVK